MRRILLVIIALLVILICVTVLAGAYFLSNRVVAQVSPPTAPAAPPPLTVPPEATLGALPSPAPVGTDTQLFTLPVPRNDPVQIDAAPLKSGPGVFATPAPPPTLQVGAQSGFWVSRDITGTMEFMTATLRYVEPHVYMWVENGQTANDNGLKVSANLFETKIYPTDRQYLGSEWTPGIDDDPHIYILNTRFRGGAIGYFSSPDEFPKSINHFSNQHELIYMNLAAIQPGSQQYAGVLSHEFAHMIHWNGNKREGSWVTEGFGDLAMQLNGYPQAPYAFVEDPDVQLDAWTGTVGAAIPHYIASYLFLSYDLNRFGDGILHDMITSGTHDIQTVQHALDKDAGGLAFDSVFADWVVANYIDDKALGSRYSYRDTPLGLRPQKQFSQYPALGQGLVHQYGTEYMELKPAGQDVTFTFEGMTQVKVVPTDPHSSSHMWWGNRVDQSDTTLTRSFDLTGVKKATLYFWTWYDVETDFDYGYVEVSTDNGKTWHTLPGRSTTMRDPNGANYGNGLTCKSGTGCGDSAGAAQWIQEQMDLSPYAGQPILLRFEYVTDAIYSGPGWAIDDISIPEINFKDDAEQGDNGWQAQGFSRTDNVLLQHFIVQAIEYGPDGQPTKIVPVTLDASNHGELRLTGFGKDISSVVLAISGSTPVTWEEATYRFSIQ